MLMNGAKGLRASEDFYDRFVEVVIGYSIEGEPLDVTRAEHLALVPLSHKILVMGELRRRAEGAAQD
jgi:hypothetical protein